MTRAALALKANRESFASRRPGAPFLTATSPIGQVEAWLQWNDPNGAHTAEAAERQGADRYQGDEAWEALEQMLAD
jgi:hypothetical protein